MIDKITDYNAVLTKLVTGQFLESDTFLSVIDTMAQRADDLEDALYAILDQTWIENAQGAWLDEIGDMVDIARAGRDDASYRKVIRLRIAVNVGAGQIPLVIRVVKDLYSATTVNYIPDYPAGFIIEQDGELNLIISGDLVVGTGEIVETDTGDTLIWGQDNDTVNDIIEDVIPSGVRLTITEI